MRLPEVLGWRGGLRMPTDQAAEWLAEARRRLVDGVPLTPADRLKIAGMIYGAIQEYERLLARYGEMRPTSLAE